MAIDMHIVDDKKKDDRNKRDFTHNLLHLAEPLRELWPTMLPSDADGRYPSVRSGPYAAPPRAPEAPA
ncbi:MAG TPA: hypothetical protein VHN14_01115 [Kofleriaceae bacterium]|jgi:hypothetical protein|nr:hypothetical protein [Kofleriaceae bacterium]